MKRSLARAERLARVDRLAALALAGDDIRFRVAASRDEREAIFRLRYRVVVQRGWGRPEDFPDGMERDAFDSIALHLGGWRGTTLLATARLVFPARGRLLPTEDAFGLRFGPGDAVVDISRMIVTRDTADPRHRLFARLLLSAWPQMRARGATRACGAFTPAMVRLIGAMGYRVRTLGGALRYWGEPRYPVLVDVLADVDRLSRAVGRILAGATSAPGQEPRGDRSRGSSLPVR